MSSNDTGTLRSIDFVVPAGWGAERSFRRRSFQIAGVNPATLVSFSAFFFISFFLGLFEIIMAFVSRGSYMHETMLPLEFKVYIAVQSVLAWGLLFAVISMLTVRLSSFFKRNSESRLKLQIILSICLTLPFVIGDFISWECFRASGCFVSCGLLNFAVFNLRQILLSMYEQEGILPFILLGIFSVLWGVGLFLPFLFRRFLASRFMLYFLICLTVILVSLMPFFIMVRYEADKVYSGSTVIADGMPFNMSDYFNMMLSERSAPMLGLAYALIWKSCVPPSSERALAELPVYCKSRPAEHSYMIPVSFQDKDKYNVIVIWVESMRADRLISCGAKREIMPNLEKLAASSRVFVNARSTANHTNLAIMAPFASLYPYSGEGSYEFPSEIKYPVTRIYEILNKAGYRTSIFSSENESWCNLASFMNSSVLDVFLHSAMKKTEFKAGMDDAEKMHAGKFNDEYTVSQAISWIKSSPRAPFCMFLSLQQSHFPYIIPEYFPKKFSPYILDFKIRYSEYMKPKSDVMMNNYDNSLHYIDHQLGQLFKTLERENLMKKTIIILAGDHGEEFYEHDAACHGQHLYEETVRVPLLVYAPALLESGIDRRPAQTIDISPTVLGLLKLPPHPNFQGRNLAAAEDFSLREIYLVSRAYPFRLQAIVKGNRKLIVDWSGSLELSRLYNLAKDPLEKDNIVLKEPAVALDLYMRLKKFMDIQRAYYEHSEMQDKYMPPSWNRF